MSSKEKNEIILKELFNVIELYQLPYDKFRKMSNRSTQSDKFKFYEQNRNFQELKFSIFTVSHE